MKTIGLGLFVAFLLCCVPPAPAQEGLPAAAREVLKQFEDEAAALDKKTEADVQKLRDKTVGELKKLQDLFCKEAKLDEAVAVRNQIRSLQAGTSGTTSDNLPPAAREVVKQHEEELAEIHKKAEAALAQKREKTLKDLQELQDAYCKDAKLDEAVAVRNLLRELRDGLTNVLPDPGYPNHQPTEIGKVYYYEVTGVAVGQVLYGSDIYAMGSYLGMAAVHCGVLKPNEKKVVKVTILPGQASYPAMTRNGVASNELGQAVVSFKVERAHAFVFKQPANSSQTSTTNPLIGTWVAVSMVSKGEQLPELVQKIKMIITADTITLPDTGQEATYKINVGERRKTIDICFGEGQGMLKGIYAMRGDTLKLCLSNRERPTRFATQKDTETILLVFKRESK